LTVFGHPLNLSEAPSRSGSFDLVKWSQPIKRWFEQIAGERARHVPDAILRAPRDMVIAYLQGLFDTDGYINNQGVIGLKMKGACSGFLHEIQMLLNALGIDSKILEGISFLKATERRYPHVDLFIRSRESTERFMSIIGFTEPAKRNNFAIKETRTKDVQMYPVPNTFLSAYRKVHPEGTPQTEFPRSFYNLASKVKRTGLVPRKAVRLLISYADTRGIEGDDITFLRGLLNLQVMQVASVEDTGRVEPVVDLEVSGDHEYQTGPILSHNSADIVTASWMDEDLAKANRVQFQCLKSRDQKPFEMLWSRVEWPCRRILTCWDTSPGEAKPNEVNLEEDANLKDLL
jgi:hypothetical protein